MVSQCPLLLPLTHPSHVLSGRSRSHHSLEPNSTLPCLPPLPDPRCSSEDSYFFPFCFLCCQLRPARGLPVPRKTSGQTQGATFLLLMHCLQLQHLWEHPKGGHGEELLEFHGSLSVERRGRVQLFEVLQSLTWKGYQFLKLLFQPADFFAKLNVIHPAETQMKPLRETLGEERCKTSRAKPSTCPQCPRWGAQICPPSHGNRQPLHLRAAFAAKWVVSPAVGKAKVLSF